MSLIITNIDIVKSSVFMFW